jgi:uncharacterized protein
MAPVQKLACAVALLTAIGLLAVAPNTTQDELLEASAAGDLSRVKTLLAAKTNVNAKDQQGYTALIVASSNGYLEVVRALPAEGADVNAEAANGTALTIASQKGSLEVVRVLLAAGADVNAKAFNGETATSLAKKGGHPDVVQLLEASHPLPDK